MRPRKCILCVDDNEQILSVRKFLLETRGYRVVTAASAHEALDLIQNSTPGSFDLLLSDLVMPQMDGNELVRRAKQLHSGLPAMIVSGTVNAFDRASAADVFLPKGGCSPAEILERVRVLVARKRGPKKAVPASVFEPLPAFAAEVVAVPAIPPASVPDYVQAATHHAATHHAAANHAAAQHGQRASGF
jgi:two-component system response regulator CpxR